MKVKELIAELSECDPELEVLLIDHHKFTSPQTAVTINLCVIDIDVIDKDSLDLILDSEPTKESVCLIM